MTEFLFFGIAAAFCLGAALGGAPCLNDFLEKLGQLYIEKKRDEYKAKLAIEREYK